VVRLLAIREGAVFTVPRADRLALDIPSLRVDGADLEQCLADLVTATFGRPLPTELFGFVRNTVAMPSGDYPWPVPEAHFSVWRVEVPANCHPQGTWLQASEAEAELASRHWWPMAAYALDQP
jgi:hypothetical protein